MAFRIGEIYRYSNSKESGVPAPIKDGLPNFFYETYSANNESNIWFQKGIHNIAAVSIGNNEKRIPAIIISSSPHKARTDITPWEDEFDPDYGRIRYYGDNKSNEMMANEAPGNALLLDMFMRYSSPDKQDRMQATPLIFFKRVEYDGRKKGI